MNILSYTFEEYVERVRAFHDFAAPGVVIGGFMVDLAYQHLPTGGLFNAICETPKCLPDAIQILTAKTVGNGRLTVINLGRYAIAFYEIATGEGVRVALDPAKTDAWPEIKSWFFKLKTKKEQDYPLLMEQIREAGTSVCSVESITVATRFLGKNRRGSIAVCPKCKEAYPIADGATCLGCQEETPYGASEIPKSLGGGLSWKK